MLLIFSILFLHEFQNSKLGRPDSFDIHSSDSLETISTVCMQCAEIKDPRD